MDTTNPGAARENPAPDRPLPVFDVLLHDAAVAPEIQAAVARVLASGWFILGAEGARFEERFANWLGGGQIVGVNSGTDALRLALTAGGIGPGDGVLAVPNTAVPTVSAISATGATPQFVDVDPDTGLIDASAVEQALQPNTRAIVPVHLYGRAAAMEPLLAIARRHNLLVVEDAAQAHGAIWHDRMAGTWADFGCFSFYPSKNLGAYGDGGAIWTAGRDVADQLKRLRNYGQSDRYVHESIGFNSRLDEVQAAILTVKLPYLEAWNRRRQALAAHYRNLLAPLPVQLPALFAIRVKERDALRYALTERGIQTQIHYPIPIHLQLAYRYLGYAAGDFPHAEAWCAETLSLPFSPALREEDLERVARALAEALRVVATG
jgi:dTDP-4-amino-4,6-dideoxygalactose transaminase